MWIFIKNIYTYIHTYLCSCLNSCLGVPSARQRSQRLHSTYMGAGGCMNGVSTCMCACACMCVWVHERNMLRA